MPEQARVPDHAAARGPQADPPRQRRGPQDAPPPPHAAPPAPDAAPGQGGAPGQGAAPGDGAEPPRGEANAVGKLPRVVVCKYVRKPGADEVYSHPIVVNANALVGKGFDGTFPFPFSDGQVSSMAIRYAEKGESAREVGATECPATSEVPPGGEPGGGEPGGGEPGGGDPGDGDEVGGGSESDDEIAAVAGVSDVAPGAADGAAVRAAVDARSGWLPATGLDEHLALVALAGGLVTLLGGALVAIAARRRRTA